MVCIGVLGTLGDNDRRSRVPIPVQDRRPTPRSAADAPLDTDIPPESGATDPSQAVTAHVNLDPQPLPAWVRIADLATVLFALLAIGLVIGSRIRLSLGPVYLTIGSPLRQALIAAAIAAVRHWRYPRPRLHERMAGAWRRFRAEPAMRTLTAQYWTIRLSILLTGYLAVGSFGLPEKGPFRVSENEFANLPARWDSGWYLSIAAEGYQYRASGGQQNIAFMPGFPVLMRIGGAFLGVDHDRMRADPKGPDRGRLLWSGVIVALVLGWVASIWLFRLARQWLDEPRALAGVVLLQAYPFSLFYGAAYSEALYLASCVGALWFFSRGAWLAAAAWGLAAGMSRPNGFVVSIPLGLLLLQRVYVSSREARDRPRVWRDIGAPLLTAAAPGLSMLAFSALIYQMTGNPFRWAQLHGAWGREYQSILKLADSYYGVFANEGLYTYTSSAPIDALNLAAAVFMLVAVVPVWRRFGTPYAALLLATVLPPLTMGGVLSMGRITSTVFPALLWLGAALTPGARRSVTFAFLVLQGLTAALFFTWRPLF